MIKILCVGKIKERFLKEAIVEYTKRLSKYTNLKIIEVEDYNSNNDEINMNKEADLIEKHIEQKDYIITLEIDGTELTSTELSNKIDSILSHNSNITFIIGGSHGLSSRIKSNEKLSFSKLTFPHQLFRVILLEQIYRSFKIMKNETYHK